MHRLAPLLLLALGLLFPTTALPQSPTGPIALDAREVKVLSELRSLKELGPLLQHRSPEERRAIFLAVAVERGLLQRAEADDLLQAIGAVPGFDAAARQLCGAGSPARDGALYEMRLARAFAARGVRVVEIRKRFLGDPKKQWTDIDVIVEYPAGAFVAIECKSGHAPADSVGADAGSMVAYADKNPGTRMAFSFLGAPTPLARKLLAGKNILILEGPPAEQVSALLAVPVAKE